MGLAGRRGRIAAIVAAFAALWGLGFVIEEPVLLFLLPALAGAFWFGRWTGAALGAAASALYATSQLLGMGEPAPFPGEPIRLLVYVALGYGVGWLSEERGRLARTVATQDRELGELQAIQEALTPPTPPVRPGLSLASCYVPAEEGVGGDFYLVAEGPSSGSTIVAVGDVVGKGVAAAQRAAFVRTAIATAAPYTDDPCRLLELANQSLIERAGRSSIFVTVACMSFWPADATVQLALAGHPAPMLLDRGEPLLNGGRPGAPLGLDETIECRAAKSSLLPGSGLLLFTDGLVEARSPANPASLFGEERVARLVTELRGEAPDAIVTRLQRAAQEFAGQGLSDDLCVVALRAD